MLVNHISFSIENYVGSFNISQVLLLVIKCADPGGRAVKGVGLRPLAFWDCGFESLREHGCLSRVSSLCCQVEVSATGRSLIQGGPNEFCVVECDREASIMRKPWPTGGCCAM